MITHEIDASVAWDDGVVVAIDQRALPHEYRLLRMHSVDQLIEAITTLAIRGAPALGLTGALGVALSAHRNRADDAAIHQDAARLAEARPTAVNLAWGVRRAEARVPAGPEAVLAEAQLMLDEDARVNRTVAYRTVDLLETLLPGRKLRILTHCNTGSLATAAVGTALGAIMELSTRGRLEEVLVDETRPLLQGARLTTWELGRAGVPYRLCVDSAAAAAMSRGLVDCVLVGADRIAANGDTANKIGTYGLAVAAARHRIPFIVVAPESSWDRSIVDGRAIEIEDRDRAEVVGFAGVSTAPADSRVFNPAFDITPAELITALVSEQQTIEPGGSATLLVNLCRQLYERGWLPGTSGNLSTRIPTDPNRALITASGCAKGELTTSHLVGIQTHTGKVSTRTAHRASAETAIHAALYRATDAGAVIHAHSPYATAVATAAGNRTTVSTVRIENLELLKGLALSDPTHTELPVFPNWPDVSRIATNIDDYYGTDRDAPPALLLAGHGLTAWGATLGETRDRLECIESLCQLMILGGSRIPFTHNAIRTARRTMR